MIPADWDTAGRVVSVAIATYQEEKFGVTDGSTVRSLLGLLQNRVVVEGTLLCREGLTLVDVQKIRIDDSPITALKSIPHPEP